MGCCFLCKQTAEKKKKSKSIAPHPVLQRLSHQSLRADEQWTQNIQDKVRMKHFVLWKVRPHRKVDVYLRNNFIFYFRFFHVYNLS